MADRAQVGSVSVQIVPSAEGFAEKVRVIVEDASKDNVRIKVDADTTEADAKIDETKARAAGIGSSAGGGIGILGASIAAALPLLPELSAGLVAISGAAFAAGAGLVSFGAVALTDITNATNATQQLQQAQLAVQNATSNTARADALTKEQALVASLGPNTIALGAAITSLTGVWKSFSAGFTPEITRDVTQFSTILTTSLPLVQPLVTAGAGAVSTIISNLNTALQSPDAKQFFAWLAGAAEHDILSLTNAFGGFGAGVLQLFKAFAPVETLVVNGLAGMGTAFDKWASNLAGTQGFQQFLRYVEANGPLLTKTLADVGLAFGHILEALTPLLPPILHVIDAFARLIAQHQPLADMLAAVLAGLVALKILITVSGWFEAFGGVIEGVVTKLDFLRAAELASGDSINVAPAVASIGEIGAAADGAAVSVGSLLSLLGTGALTGAAVIAGGAYLYHTGQDAMKHLGDFLNSVANINPNASGGAGGNAGTSDGMGSYWGSGLPSAGYGYGYLTPAQSGVPAPPFYLANPGGRSLPNPNPFGVSVVGDQTAANLTSTFISQVPGAVRDLAWGAAGSSGGAGGGGTGNPSNYTLPFSGGVGAANAAANNAQGLAALLGLNLMQALAAGITTGTNPLTQTLTNINLKLTGPAQTLGTALDSLTTAALSAGQAAAKTLAFNVTGPNTVGSQTLISPDGRGGLTTTVQSQLVGNANNQLLTDQRFVADIKKATALGLAPALLGQFVQQGPSSLDVLDALVNSGPSAVAQLNATNASITALGNQYGIAAASQQYGPQEVALLQQIRDYLAGQQSHPAQTGQHVADALNGVAKTAAHKAVVSVGKGPVARVGGGHPL